MWWNGPSLLDDAEQWVTLNSAAHLESSVLVGWVEQAKPDPHDYDGSLPYPLRFSKWQRLLHATCYVLDLFPIL